MPGFQRRSETNIGSSIHRRPGCRIHASILDATLRVVAARGPTRVTTEAVAEEMGGDVGSIHYRVPTKDHLLAQLWMRCARGGRAGFLEALSGQDLDEALDAAMLHYPRWSRIDHAAAQVLAAYGREQLTPDWPDAFATDRTGHGQRRPHPRGRRVHRPLVR